MTTSRRATAVAAYLTTLGCMSEDAVLGPTLPPDEDPPPKCATTTELGVVEDVSAGSTHACALFSSGRVYCWGDNTYLQLGNLDCYPWPCWDPVPVLGLACATSIEAGGIHTCAVLESGEVVCWGDNSWGQLGQDSGPFGGSIDPVRFGDMGHPAQVLASSASTAVVTAEAELLISGKWSTLFPYSSPQHWFVLTKVYRIPETGMLSCAMADDRTVQCWGPNTVGEVGDGTTEYRDVPTTVLGLGDVATIDVGYAGRCALRANGTVWCWGGWLNDPESVILTEPQEMAELQRITMLRAGATHFCGVDVRGSLLCWGTNGSGRLGDGTLTDRFQPALAHIDDVRSVAPGHEFTCALRNDRSVWCWGDNFYGQLGVPPYVEEELREPTRIPLDNLVVPEEWKAPPP